MDEAPGGYQNSLIDQVAIITGAAKGIGRGIALGFAKAGAHIVIADIDSAESANTAREIEKLGRQALVIKTDIRREADLDNLVDQTLVQFKRIDLLVNNAGINAPGGFLGASRQDIHSVIDTDLVGPFILTQRTALEMVRLGISGRILCISSIHSVVAHYHPHYSVAKAGIERLVIDAALELAPHHIRVNGIRPGGIMIRGDMVYGNPANTVPAIPLEHRNGLPSEVADLALFLVTEHSRYITGAIITIDGGLSQISYSALGSYDHILAEQQALGIPQPPSGAGVTVQEINRNK